MCIRWQKIDPLDARVEDFKRGSSPTVNFADNSIATLPAFAFTPQTDRAKIAPTGNKKTPITKAVPGLQLNARIASDPTGQARFLLRLSPACVVAEIIFQRPNETL